MSQRPFAVFDIDGTLIRWQLYHAIADTLAKRGFIDAATYGEIRNARMSWKQRDKPDAYKDYEEKLVDLYNQTVTKLTAEQFTEAARSVFDEYKDQVYRYTRDLIKKLKDENYLLFAISRSQTEVIEQIAEYYGFDDCVGTHYERVGIGYSGRITSGMESKDVILRKLVAKHHAAFQDSLAVGDSESDAPMLAIANRAIAFNPTEKLFRTARNAGWKIVVERKNVIYELERDQGAYTLHPEQPGLK